MFVIGHLIPDRFRMKNSHQCKQTTWKKLKFRNSHKNTSFSSNELALLINKGYVIGFRFNWLMHWDNERQYTGQ